MNTNVVKQSTMDRKIISVSKKRQITIPLKYFKQLGLDHEVECTLEDGALVIRPLQRDAGEFSVEILKDLVAQGYTGDDLIKEFEIQRQNIKKAVSKMLKEADSIASGETAAESFDDVFGSED